MYKDKKIAAVIAAAGVGTRLGGSVPKQYLEIGGKAMVVKTAEIFLKNSYIDYIVVVADAENLEKCRILLTAGGIGAIVAAGGKTRQDSVYQGLLALPGDTDYVLIHDGARPFVSEKLINETIYAVLEKQAVVCAAPVNDTIRMRNSKEGSVTLDRSCLYAVQTPQAFEKELITDAYTKACEEGFYATDDAALAERAGYVVHIIDGSFENIKITTIGDIPVKREIRVGTGFDAHRFAAGRKLFLGGVYIPFEKGLLGHSDADVLLHAVMDALLGAAGLLDIGAHFPDNDEKYKDISSLILLGKIAGLLAENGYEIVNIDATVIAEKPKIAGFTGEMRKAVAGALGIAQDRINIKGTTTEKMGFTGREEGIAAQAVCSLAKLV
jgi:2-C-methyl-D-erythritol 4-phosphate cytidylyltransferase/2-C-methyl-D-erythritol 2,4-cyclodiphosphate synthase